MPLRIGLIGWGTMGSALGELIAGGPMPVELRRVAVRDPERARERGLPSGMDIGPVADLLADQTLDAVVELTGGIEGPLAWARATLAGGRSYVTGNKALLANHGGELAALARSTGAGLLGSASVGGGTPMIETVAHLAHGGRVARLRGLLNATTTFILAAMADGRSYDDALAAAQRAGYAEPDPTFDVSGRDAAQKIAVLASVAWGRWRAEREVSTRGIVGVVVDSGQTIRLVGEADEEGMRVGPMELEPGDVMAAVSGIECLLEVHLQDGSRFRISGPGAGGPVSVGATYADLARLLAGERPVLFAP
ncbi:MAG TPA: homoserine dehydrogenase [Candidatus Limnocylindria bacterium]|jgi:homoserine dehydrogenase